MKKETRVTHQPKVTIPKGNKPLVDPVSFGKIHLPGH